MAKDIKRHLSHLKSSGGTAPAAADLLYGEIAVGYKDGEERLYIKNSSDDVVTIGVPAGDILNCLVTSAIGDTEIAVDLGVCNPTGRTLTVTHATGSAQSGFKKLSSDSYGHITGGSNVALSDLTGLGAVSSARTVSAGAGLTGGGNLSANITLKAALSSETQSTLAATAMGSTTDRQYAVGLDKNGVLSVNIPWTNVNNGYVPTGRTISTASGLTGGGNLSANRTIGLEATGTSGTYGPTANVTGTEGTTIVIPQITTDAYGRVTSVTERTLTNKNSTYTAATAAPPKVSSGNSVVGTSANYARQDHTHGIDLATGDGVGQVKIAGKNVSVSGFLESETALTSTSDTKLPTSKAVAEYVSQQMASALTYKGAISSNNTLKPPYKTGDLWVVSSAGTYAGKACEVGDYLIAKNTVTDGTSVVNADWDAINGENQVTNSGVTLSWGSTSTIAKVDGTNITVALPANPNTDTTVTAVGNHYTPSSSATISKTASSSTNATWGSSDFITGVTLYKDAAGHITDMAVSSLQLPGNPNTDTKVAQASANTDSSFPILVKNTANNTAETAATKFATGITINPSSNTITATNYVGKVNGITPTDNTGTVTKVSTGAGLVGGDITTTGTIKTALSSETKSSLSATTMGSTASRQYAVGLDANGVLSVNIPWTDTAVTAVGNHYTPSSSATISKTASSSTNATWGSSDFVTGVTLYKDAAGHITDMAVSSLQLPTPTTLAYKTIKVSGATTVDCVAASAADTITLKKDDAITLTGVNGAANADTITFGLGDVICGDYA